MKYVIISQPKAGTYLTANLLMEFNIQNSYIHVFGDKIKKWDKTRYNRQSFTEQNYIRIKNPINFITDEIPDENFVVTHVPPIYLDNIHINNYKKILVTRPYGETVDSASRMKDVYDFSKIHIRRHRKILLWRQFPNIFEITFNDLISKNVEKIDQLQIFLFDEIKFDSLNCIENALKADSPTKSNIRK